jgi:hypothetical protein
MLRLSAVKLNPQERAVLKVLAREVDSDCNCFPFAPICRITRLNRTAVRRACRSLARKGLAEYHKGLWTMDGEPGGAGYAATMAGADLLQGDAA